MCLVGVMNKFDKTIWGALSREGGPLVCSRKVLFHHWSVREYYVHPLWGGIS